MPDDILPEIILREIEDIVIAHEVRIANIKQLISNIDQHNRLDEASLSIHQNHLNTFRSVLVSEFVALENVDKDINEIISKYGPKGKG